MFSDFNASTSLTPTDGTVSHLTRLHIFMYRVVPNTSSGNSSCSVTLKRFEKISDHMTLLTVNQTVGIACHLFNNLGPKNFVSELRNFC